MPEILNFFTCFAIFRIIYLYTEFTAIFSSFFGINGYFALLSDLTPSLTLHHLMSRTPAEVSFSLSNRVYPIWTLDLFSRFA